MFKYMFSKRGKTETIADTGLRAANMTIANATVAAAGATAPSSFAPAAAAHEPHASSRKRKPKNGRRLTPRRNRLGGKTQYFAPYCARYSRMAGTCSLPGITSASSASIMSRMVTME